MLVWALAAKPGEAGGRETGQRQSAGPRDQAGVTTREEDQTTTTTTSTARAQVKGRALTLESAAPRLSGLGHTASAHGLNFPICKMDQGLGSLKSLQFQGARVIG